MISSENTRVGLPVRAKGNIVFPIERTQVIQDIGSRGCWFHATKQLIALVVQTAAGVQAFGMEGRPMTIGELMKTVPELEGCLNKNGFS